MDKYAWKRCLHGVLAQRISRSRGDAFDYLFALKFHLFLYGWRHSPGGILLPRNYPELACRCMPDIFAGFTRRAKGNCCGEYKFFLLEVVKHPVRDVYYNTILQLLVRNYPAVIVLEFLTLF